jgi:wyosine [tRNA(Phe)-imidazoG37] synthetase (radical SAM superfamily)
MILFDQIIFGPIHSRRLGVSLGVNLLPIDAKVCTFDCVYCECGFNTPDHGSKLPTRFQVKEALEMKLHKMLSEGQLPDVITFSGNGEPTLHAEFGAIIDDTIALRNEFCPSAKVTVLSNSSRIHTLKVFAALHKVDHAILKFDSAIDGTLKHMDRPVGKHMNVAWFINHLKKFEGNIIIQTMFLRGEYDGKVIDNTTDVEVKAWLGAMLEIRPKQIMMYSLDRETPAKNIEKISFEEMSVIADKARALGFDVLVSS